MSQSKLSFNLYCPVFTYVMFLSFYTFIIISIVRVITDNVDVSEYKRFEPLGNKKTLQRLKRNVKHTSENKRDNEVFDEAKLFEDVQEGNTCSSTPKVVTVSGKDNTLCEIKMILQKLLNKLNCMDEYKKDFLRKITTTANPFPIIQESSHTSVSLLDLRKGKRNENLLRRPRWGQWTSWSACSVTCGKGREIRWRHCMEQCDNAETEMEEKTCQLPACGPGKFFGIQL